MMALAVWAAAACVAVEGDRILAGDLAAAAPWFAAMAPDTEVGYSPAPGARRTFPAAELARLTARHGASVGPRAARELQEICVERVMEELAPETLLAAIGKAVAEAEAKIELVDWSRYPVPRGTLEFPRGGISGLRDRHAPFLWRGCVKYGAGRRFAIWARVRVTVRVNRVIAREPLPAGQPIRPEQLRVETSDVFPFAAPPASRLADVAGRVPRRSIAAGAAVLPGFLDAPREIHSGDVVAVAVSSGAARLTFEGRAEAGGRRGELILVRDPRTGKAFRARVESAGKVAVAVESVAAVPAPGEK